MREIGTHSLVQSSMRRKHQIKSRRNIIYITDSNEITHKWSWLIILDYRLKGIFHLFFFFFWLLDVYAIIASYDCYCHWFDFCQLLFVILRYASYSDYINFEYDFAFRAWFLPFIRYRYRSVFRLTLELAQRIFEEKTCKWYDIMVIKQFIFTTNEPNKNKLFAFLFVCLCRCSKWR